MNLKESIKYICDKFNEVDQEEIIEIVMECLESEISDPNENILDENDLSLINPEGIIVNMLVEFIPIKDALRS